MDRAETGSAKDAEGNISSDPTSFVAAEIHLGRRSASFSDEPTALQHSSCVPERGNKNIMIYQRVPRTRSGPSSPLRCRFAGTAPNN
jgi:hypothetical protein